MVTDKIKLFTDSDLDGVSCGIAALTINCDTVNIDYATPTNINRKLHLFIDSGEYKKYSYIYITDLCIDENVAKKINRINGNTKNFFLFDHHASNTYAEKYEWATVITHLDGRPTCGAELFWLYIKYNQLYHSANINLIDIVDDYVEYVRLWDTWDWGNAGEKGIYAKDLNTLLQLYQRDQYTQLIINKIFEDDGEFIRPSDIAILAVEEKRKESYIKHKINGVKFAKYDDIPYIAVFAESYISELADTIIHNTIWDEPFKFVAVINIGDGVVSLRSSKDSGINVASLAEKFGGGGHPQAAGFKFPKVNRDKFIRSLFKLSKEN